MDFAKSESLTFGMELEYQIVNSRTGLLSPSSLEIWEQLHEHKASGRYALEATLSTIELNTSVHQDADQMLGEAMSLTKTLVDIAESRDLLIRGGGTQLTQFWNDRVMAPTDRANELGKKYGFLPKRFSTYGMHVHIGAASADDAILMGNGLQALVPLFIALSAASPYLQMSDTGFCAARPLESLVYPHGGPMPRVSNWADFEEVAAEAFATNLAATLKDIYWDVRPKPEYGTIEVRVFDTPLSVQKAVALAAFTRGCASLLLSGKLSLPTTPPPRTAERVSRFLACRDGLGADLFDPFTETWLPARTWFGRICELIAQAPVQNIDLQYIRWLLGHTGQWQDPDVMRAAWVDAHAPFRNAPDLQLAHYSRGLAELLMAMRPEMPVP